MSPSQINSAVVSSMAAITNSEGGKDNGLQQLFALTNGLQTPMHLRNFKTKSQRQIRKNRRRAHAAGMKNVYGK